MKKNQKKNNLLWPIIFCVVIITILTIYITFPLIKNFNSSLPLSQVPKEVPEKYDYLFPTDTLNCLYRLWLVKTQVFNFKSPILDGYQFNINGPHTEGISLWLFPLQIIFIPLTFIFSEIASYNIIYLLSYIFTGLSMFFLVNYYTKNWVASLYSAILFTFIPARILHSFGHSGALLFFVFPLTIYLLEISLNNKKWLLANFAASFFIFSMALGEWHWCIYLTSLVVLFYIYKLLSIKFFYNKKHYKRLLISAIITFSGVIISGIYLIFIKYTNLSSSIAGEGRSLAEVNYYSPPIKNLLRNYTGSEKNIYLGWLNVVLAIILAFLLVALPKKLKKIEKSRIIFYFFILLLAIFFSLGTTINNPPIYSWLHKHLPFFDIIRVPARIKVVTTFSLSVITGLFIAKINELLLPILKKKTWYKIIFYLLVFVLIFINFFNLTDIRDSNAPDKKTKFSVMESRANSGLNQYLKTNTPKDKKVLYLPFFYINGSNSSIYQFNTRESETVMINGYTPTRPKEANDFYEAWLKELNVGIVRIESLDKLKEIGVEYIATYKNIDQVSDSTFSSTTITQSLKQSEYLEIVFEDNDGTIFKIHE